MIIYMVWSLHSCDTWLQFKEWRHNIMWQKDLNESSDLWVSLESDIRIHLESNNYKWLQLILLKWKIDAECSRLRDNDTFIPTIKSVPLPELCWDKFALQTHSITLLWIETNVLRASQELYINCGGRIFEDTAVMMSNVAICINPHITNREDLGSGAACAAGPAGAVVLLCCWFW